MNETEKESPVKAAKEATEKAYKAAKKEYDAERYDHQTEEERTKKNESNANWYANRTDVQKAHRKEEL